MKIFFRLFLFCLVFLSAGCRPEGVLPTSGMTDLLVDMYLTDGCIEAAADAQQAWDSLDVYGLVLESHGVTREHYDESVEYYLRHPRDFARIYKKVQAKLEEMGRMVDERDQEEFEEIGEVEEVEEWGEGTEPETEKEKPAKKRKNTRKRLSKKEMEELEKRLEE